jgi:hypothetical protein
MTCHHMHTERPITFEGWRLVDELDGSQIMEGDQRVTFRNEWVIVCGGRPPHKPSSSGFVYVSGGVGTCEFYPSVVGAKWVED